MLNPIGEIIVCFFCAAAAVCCLGVPVIYFLYPRWDAEDMR